MNFVQRLSFSKKKKVTEKKNLWQIKIQSILTLSPKDHPVTLNMGILSLFFPLKGNTAIFFTEL